MAYIPLEDFVSESLTQLIEAGVTGAVSFDVWVAPYGGDIVVVNHRDDKMRFSNIKFTVEIGSKKSELPDNEEIESVGVKGNYDHVTRTATYSFITNQCEFERLFERITCNIKSGGCNGCRRCIKGDE